MYHSVHDNLYWMTEFGDPQFTAHQALGRVWGQMMLSIATTPLLPYHPTDYAKRLNETYEELMKNHGETLEKNYVGTGETMQYKCIESSDVDVSLHRLAG